MPLQTNNLPGIVGANRRLAPTGGIARALAILEAKLEPDHPHTQIVRENLESLS